MNITIKQIQGILLGNLVVLVLASCSSSPSPWSQQDDSPWQAKRGAEESGLASEEFVEVPLEEPVEMMEPEPIYAEPMAMEEPVEMMEQEEMMEPEPAAATGIMGLPATSYAVQVYAGATIASVVRYQEAHGLQDLQTVETSRDGSSIYVLVSLHDDRAGAKAAAADLEQKTGSKPWVRSMAGLQKVAVE